MAPAGVQVTIVEPGTFATDFASTAHVVAPDEVYAPTVGEFLTGFAALPPSAFGDSPTWPTRSTVSGPLDSRPAELEKSAQSGRLAQQH